MNRNLRRRLEQAKREKKSQNVTATTNAETARLMDDLQGTVDLLRRGGLDETYTRMFESPLKLF